MGNFDGVHRGHQALVARARAAATALGAPVCAYTFHPAPRDVLRPGNGVPRIQSLDERLAALGEAGVDQVVIEAFTPEFATREPAWFAKEILGARLRAREVVIGWDFRFGRQRAGDASALRDLLGVPVHALEPVLHGGAAVSSSRIREALRRGDVALAATLLGHAHALRGEVVHGDARGRELGFPTANVATRAGLIPADGVYAVRAHVGDSVYDAVANIGHRPTFGERERAVEVHLLDFSGDLYGAELRVELVARIRQEQRFDDLNALVNQIHQDIGVARGALTAGGHRR